MNALTHTEARRDLHNGRRWLDNKAAAALDAHLSECAECRAYAADVAALEPALTRALHARWDGVEAPRAAPKAEDGAAQKQRPRGLNSAWGLAGFAVLLVAVLVGLPYLAGQPLEGTAGPVATRIGTLTLGTAVVEPEAAALERSLFVTDWGTFESIPEGTTVVSPPRVLAWDPATEQVLWAAEVGRAPRMAVEANGQRVFVVSDMKPGVETLAGLTYNDNAPEELGTWLLTLSVLDATNGKTLLTIDLREAAGEDGPPWAWTGPVGAALNLLYVHRYTTADSLAAINLDTGELLAPRWTLCTEGYPQQVQLAPGGTAVYALCAPTTISGELWVQITRFGPFDPILIDLPELNGVGRWGNGLVLSPDGSRLYVADTLQGFLGEIDIARGVVARTTLYKPSGIQSQSEAVLSLSPNGRMLYLGTLTSSQPEQDIWAVDTADLKAVAHRGMLPSRGLTETAPPNIHTFAADWTGQLYVATDQGLAVFDILDERMRFSYPNLPAKVTQIIPYPRSSPLAVAPTPDADISGALFVTDYGFFTGEASAQTVARAPRVAAWDPVGDRFLWQTETGLIPFIVVDRAGRYVYVVSQPNADVDTLAGLTFDANSLAAHNPAWPLRVSVLEAATGAMQQSFDLPATLGTLMPLGAVGDTLYLHRFILGTVDSLDLATGAYANVFALCAEGAFASSIQFAPDGSAIYALCTGNDSLNPNWFVQVNPLGSGAARQVPLPFGTANGLLLSPDGSRLYLAATHQGSLAELDTTTDTWLRTVQYKPGERAGRDGALMSLSPNGRLLYLSTITGQDVDRAIRAIDTTTLEVVAHREIAPLYPRALAADAAGRVFVATDEGVAGYDLLNQLELPAHLPNWVRQVAAYPVAVPLAAAPPPPDLSGLSLVAFETNRDGDREIYVMRSNGAQARNLTQRPGPDRAPAWSPDGRYLAYLADRGDATDVMVLNVEHALATTDIIPPVRVMRGSIAMAFNEKLAWSPDGTRLVFSFWPQGSSDTTESIIQLLDVTAALNGVDSPAPVELTQRGYEPKFSPDGGRLLYGRFAEGVPALFVENLATGEQVNLTVGESDIPGEYWSYSGYDWSPEGKFVAYLRIGPWTGERPDFTLARDSHAQIVIALPGGETHPVVMDIAPAPNGIFGLNYSPDGRMLMFVSDRENNGCWNIHLFSIEDQALTRVEGICYTTRTALPDWSPDSRWLIFTSGWEGGLPGNGGAREQELTALDLAQMQFSVQDSQRFVPVRLTHWIGDDFSPQWQPECYSGRFSC